MTVSAHRYNGAAELTVADSGPGLPAGARSKVFERFYTGDAARGAGLGLAIARELAERMDGRLAAPHRRRHRVHARAAVGRAVRKTSSRLAAALAAAALLLGGGLRFRRRRRQASPPATSEVTTTRVQVVEGLGREGGFDPAADLRPALPGRGDHPVDLQRGLEPARGWRRGRSGFGLRARRRRLHRHERARGDHRRGRRHRAGGPGLRRVPRRQPRAGGDHGRRPERGRGAPQDRSGRAVAHPAQAGRSPPSRSASPWPPSAAHSGSASRSRWE